MLRLKQIIALDVSRFCDATVRSPVSFGMYPSAADAGVVVPQATLPHQPLDAVRIAR